ncbi:MAG TPA: SH3 domain-containing protein [Thermomicrobiales bacterium]|nr:SH3 domain-containing protein [Thermomicrobiales bacterium]
MSALLHKTRTGFFFAMIGMLIMSMMAPTVALANEDAQTSSNQAVSNETVVSTESSESTTTSTTDENAVTEQSAPANPWQEPIDYGVANDNVKCRKAASTSAREITVIYEGQTIEITGVEIWAEGISWTPVNCAGVGGFISTGYISVETETVEEPEVQVVEETGVEESVVEETVTDQGGEQQVEQTGVEQVAQANASQTEEEETDEATSDEDQVEDAIEEPAPVEQPVLESIATGYATSAVNCRVAPSIEAETIAGFAAGNAVPVTGDVFSTEGLNWTPVNCAGVGGFVASDFITFEAPAPNNPSQESTENLAGASSVETTAPETADEPVEGNTVPDGSADQALQTTSEPTGDAAQAGTENIEEPSLAEAIVEDVQSRVPDAEQIIDETQQQIDESLGEAPEVEETAPDVGDESNATEGAEETATDVEDGGEPTIPDADELADEIIEDAQEQVDESLGNPPAIAEATEEATAEVTEEVAEEVANTDTANPGMTGQEALDTQTTDEPDEPVTTEETISEATEDTTDAGTEGATEEPQEEEGETHASATSGVAVEETESRTPIEDNAIIGTADINGTGDQGLPCRVSPEMDAPVITTLPENMSVFVLSEPDANGWMSIVCADRVGYAPATYLYSGGATLTFDPAVTGTAVVNGTGGGGLNCRSGPSTGYSVIGWFAEGATVTLTGKSSGVWVEVICGGTQGWAYGTYLGGHGSSGGDTTSDPDTNNQAPSSGTVTVSGTGGARLNCRTGASTSFPATTSVAEGTVLNVRGAASGGWLPVVCNGSDLWVYTQFVTAGGTATPQQPKEETPSNGGGTDAVTGQATVVNTDGASLRCRSGAGLTHSTITFLPAGSTVSLRSGSQGDWTAVVCAGQNGYAYSSYLSTSGGGSTAAPTPEPAPSQPSGLANGDHARTTANLNLRYDPYAGNNVAAVAPQGTVVQITGGHAGNNYYPVNWDGLKGYMSADYLVETSEALSERGGSAPTTDSQTAGGGGGTSTGNAIADFAMGYLGYPYVWATAGPSSFDCSGFTYWVIKNVVGIDIGRGLWTQIAAGTPVSRSALQPGDLVFFQNTYKAGLSHVGIYIGGNQFVHSQNEATGVVISDLDSSYYGPRWYGARRIG